MRSGTTRTWRNLCAIGVAVAFNVAALGQPRFVPLGFLNPDPFGPSIAYGVSGDGRVVVGMSNAGPDGFEAFRWIDGAI